MRVFADTNVLASALATRRLCADLPEQIVAEHTLLLGDPVLGELRRILRRSFRLTDEIVVEYVAFLRSVGVPIQGSAPITVAIPDPDDVPILAAALAGKAERFVTGDNGLLGPGAIDGLPIVTPRTAYERLLGLR